MFSRDPLLIEVMQPIPPVTRPENSFSPARLAAAGFVYHATPRATRRAAFSPPVIPTRGTEGPLPQFETESDETGSNSFEEREPGGEPSGESEGPGGGGGGGDQPGRGSPDDQPCYDPPIGPSFSDKKHCMKHTIFTLKI